MTVTELTSVGLACRFDVDIDGYSLGEWTSCKGLAVTFKHDVVKELGEHTYATYIPDRVEYARVVLQRALTAGDWQRTKTWLEFAAAAPWMHTLNVPNVADEIGPTSATITLRDGSLAEVASWTLSNALPAAWKGPQLDAKGNAVAIETLELVHEGFLTCAIS